MSRNGENFKWIVFTVVLVFCMYSFMSQHSDVKEAVASAKNNIFNEPSKVGKVGKAEKNDEKIVPDPVVPVVKKPSTEEEMFSLYGFRVISNDSLIPKLKQTEPLTCEQEFSSWLSIALSHRPSRTPPSTLPTGEQDKYTMYGFATLIHSYRNDFQNSVEGGKAKTWTQIGKMMRGDMHVGQTYGTSEHLFDAFEKVDIRGMRGAVIGTQSPWVEVYALKHGALSVLTVEYQNITTNHPHLHYIHPYQLSNNHQEHVGKYDFVASYSSLEHSGLGRYGDPMDPIGDIRESRKIGCMLRPGGLFFLGVPVGRDKLVYNLHRIYGRRRLAMMFEGYTLLHTFGSSPSLSLSEDDLAHDQGASVRQLIFVLRKD